jgi:hypothetical protein
MKRYRGIWKRVDGARVRFELSRRKGLMVRRGRLPQRTISFERLYDVAVEQPQLPLT